MASYLETVINRLKAGPDFLTSLEVARALQIDKQTFHRQRQRGKGPPYEKLPDGQIRYSRDNVIDWLMSGEICEPRGTGRRPVTRAPFQGSAPVGRGGAADAPALRPR